MDQRRSGKRGERARETARSCTKRRAAIGEPIARRAAPHCLQVTVIPAVDDPLHEGVNGVVHPAAPAAAALLGQLPAETPTARQVTEPALTTQTDVALSHDIWMPEFPHENEPWHASLESLLLPSHASPPPPPPPPPPPSTSVDREQAPSTPTRKVNVNEARMARRIEDFMKTPGARGVGARDPRARGLVMAGRAPDVTSKKVNSPV